MHITTIEGESRRGTWDKIKYESVILYMSHVDAHNTLCYLAEISTERSSFVVPITIQPQEEKKPM